MKVLVTGGAASGKSDVAERLVMRLQEPRYYLATMPMTGFEDQLRIEHHRALRQGKGFTTVDIDALGIDEGLAMLEDAPGTVLLEDLGNLIGQFFYTRHGIPRDEQIVFELATEFIGNVMQRCENLVIVCSAVGADGIPHDALDESFVRLLGQVSCAIAASCDAVVEVVCEQPIVVKGSIDGLV